MPTVYTETKCSRCEKTDKRPGAESSTVPVGWAALTLTVRGPGAGWSNPRQRVDADLCLPCTREVLAFLGVPRRRRRKAKVEQMSESGEAPKRRRGRLQKVAESETKPDPATLLVSEQPAEPSWTDYHDDVKGSIEEVEECSWAMGIHDHRVEGDKVTCLASQEQWRRAEAKESAGEQPAQAGLAVGGL